MAEHSFYEYQRLVQKEAEPELIIQLPNRGDDLEEADMRPPMIESEDASLQTPMNLVVTVAFAIAQPSCGLQFCDRYACTDNQVDSTRNMCPATKPAFDFCMLLLYNLSDLGLLQDSHGLYAPNNSKAYFCFYCSPSIGKNRVTNCLSKATATLPHPRLITCMTAADSAAVQ